MQTLKKILLVFTLTLFLFINACNESSTTTDTKQTDSSTVAMNDTSNGPIYDPTKDLLVVGPAFAKKLADTLGITMFEGILKPGDSMPMHSHPDHAFYLMDTSTVVLYLPGQNKGDTLSGDIPGI